MKKLLTLLLTLFTLSVFAQKTVCDMSGSYRVFAYVPATGSYTFSHDNDRDYAICYNYESLYIREDLHFAITDFVKETRDMGLNVMQFAGRSLITDETVLIEFYYNRERVMWIDVTYHQKGVFRFFF